MNSKHLNLKMGAVVAGLLLTISTVPALALAQVNTSITVNASTSVGGARAQVQANTITRVQTRADQEITRRLTALTALNTRIEAAVKLSASEKSSLSTTIQGQITALTNLKTTIDAETSITALRTDVQSITQSYRIFALVLPQGAIAAASDRVMTIAQDMANLQVQLQARITAAQSAGQNVSALTSAMADMTTQITTANTQAQAAISGTASLTPDNSNTTQAAANHQALLTARGNIKTATTALQAARKDAGTIVKALEAMNVSATASTSAQ